MNSYYEMQREACTMFYSQLAQKSHNGINGFLTDPSGFYDCWTHIIRNSGTVLDIGCGNGSLLRHLMNQCEHEIVPYGVDFHESAIADARNTIHPEYQDNFICCDALSWQFDVEFAYVLGDPVIVHNDDRRGFIELAESHLRPNGRLFLYTYTDGTN